MTCKLINTLQSFWEAYLKQKSVYFWQGQYVHYNIYKVQKKEDYFY